MKQKKILIFVITLISISLFLLACDPKKETQLKKITLPDGYTLEQGYKELGIIPYDKPEEAIDFKLKDLNNKSFSLSDLKGKIVFLNFWATWCQPCLREMPSIERLHQQMKGKDFIILAISGDKKKKTVVNFAKQLEVTFDILLDSDGAINDKYRIYGIPTTYIINKQGLILGKVVRTMNWDSEASIKFFTALTKQ